MKTWFRGKDVNLRRIGVLTGGGDCAGLNAVLAGLVRRVNKENSHLPASEAMEIIGLLEGWKSLIGDAEKNLREIARTLTLDDLKDSFREPGTIIFSSRTNIYSKKNVEKGMPKIAFENIQKLKLDCLCVLGGDDTLGAAQKLMEEFSFPMLGAPKTMDNDLYGTDRTFGFESAYFEASRQISNIIATAKSHKRIFVIEVMGRNAGWVALYAGVSGGAGVTILPEEKLDLDCLASQAKKMKAMWGHGIIVVSEGVKIFSEDQGANSRHKEILNRVCENPKNIVIKAKMESPQDFDAFGNPRLSGVGEIITAARGVLAPEIEYRFHNCGHSIRAVSHPSDVILGLRFGNALFEYMKEGKFGVYPALEGNAIVPRLLTEAKGGRMVDFQTQQDLFNLRNMIDCY